MADEVIAGRYRLDERLALGGMAEVWLADDLELGRRVALKLLGRDADPVRFEREARAAAALAHPNICQLYDYGKWEDRPFMVLEYLPGGTLEDRLAPGSPLPDPETARIACELAEGLAHAHARGLVHRDLKPANVLFDAEGRAKIADFGIARMGEDGTLTEAGTLLGTAAYISPEQAVGETATPASDVYSFGVILYRMLTGRLPFESENAMELVVKHRDEEPPPLAGIRPDVPARLESVAMAALAKRPIDRPRDGAALVAELEGPEAATVALGAAPTTALPLTGDRTAVIPRARPRRRPPARGRIAAILAAVALLGGAGIALAVMATQSGSSSPGTVSVRTHRRTHSTTTRAASTTAPAVSSQTTSTTTPTTTTAPATSPAITHRATTTRATTTLPTAPPATTLPPVTTAPLTTTALPTTLPVTTTTTP